MKRKNLERAVLLGIVLSVGMYGSALAEELSLEEFKSKANSENIVTVEQDTIVNGDPNELTFEDPDKNHIKDIIVKVDSGKVSFNNVNMTNSNILGIGNIIVNNNAPNKTVSGLEATTNKNSIIKGKNVQIISSGSGADAYGGLLTIDIDGELNINSDGIGIHAQEDGENPNAASNVNVNADRLIINSINGGIYLTNADVKQNIIVELKNGAQIISTGYEAGIQNSNSLNGELRIATEKGNIAISGGYAGAWVTYGSITNISSDSNNISSSRYGILNNTNSDKNGYAQITVTAKTGDNNITGVNTGIRNDGGSVFLKSQENGNKVSSNGNAIYTSGKAIVDLKAAVDNVLNAGGDDYGTASTVYAQNGSTVTLNAGNVNRLSGAVYATGKNSTVDISKLEETGTTFSRNAAGDVNNFVRSAAVIDKAGDLDGKEIIENGDGTVTTTGMDVVSALYAEKGASINLSGVNNIQTYYDDPSDTHTSERAVWAYKGADITIDGVTNISTSKYEISPENRDIAIAAGTATELKEDDFTEAALGKVEVANVNLNYKAGSAINGDILAAYGGVVNITDANAASRDVNDGAGTGIAITGDLLAGNNGKLTVDLGNSGVLIGRADDYGDAELDNGHGSGDEDGFYNPAFSSNILHGGEVTLNMGKGSQWSVQGQSWITNLNTNGNVLIDLTNASTEYESNAHALTVRNLNGDANIIMSLNGDRTQSDMLYIGKGTGTYNIELDEVVDIDDMYADSGEGFKFSGLRFATVGKGSDVDFNVTATDKGFNNIIYTVGKDVYGSNVSNHENDAYNNGDGTSLDKPGNAAVEDLLKDAEQAGAATINTNDIMLLANEPDTGENLDNNENHLNYKLIDMQTVRSDAGETMLNMSRANYSNAIYMDRLNKRLGEARYINDDPEEDEGMWVRVRHDRIGKDEAFRSQNTMYELGYDKRQECDNGKRRVGFAVDYMHGDTGYNDIAGKGEIDRYGLWLYDTWTGNKGHYVDYVAKWGHLQNDFEVYNSEGKVTGDYSNNVFSISAEYGRKKDMGNDWYFEPQAQLQLARVTGADYTTSQGTKVSVDGINSLIGRAGFRIGKDFGEEKQSTLYFKADVLHEFLGDQTIRALDGTTNGWQSVDYENQGTWYDIGIGYAAMLSQSTYAFIDLEQSFGNDNDDTYQINAGVRWTF